MILRGKAHKFGDVISTDHIVPGRYFHLRSNMAELAKHALEDADPEFAGRVEKGDFVVAGRNFGLGSSREHAAVALKFAGIGAILAQSFARIFFRNAINVGLPVLILDTSRVREGDELEIELDQGQVCNLTSGETLTFAPLPKVMQTILNDGGLIAHIIKHGDFTL